MCQHSNIQQDQHTSHERSPTVPFPWHVDAFDAHCHPTDVMASIANIDKMKTRTLVIMATRSQDQQLVAKVAAELGANRPESNSKSKHARVIPSFGWHPWFSHELFDDIAAQSTYGPASDGQEEAMKSSHYRSVLQPPPQDADFISSLPTPTPLSSFISSTRMLLEAYPHALVGEVGLDKAFRLPCRWDPVEEEKRDRSLTYGGRETRRLSPYRVSLEHQKRILEEQLRLAGEVGRAVSVHGVQAHGMLFDIISKTWRGHEKPYISRRKKRLVALEAESDSEDQQILEKPGHKPFPPRICLHSFSGSVEVVRQWLSPTAPTAIFFSFSAAINMTSTQGENKMTQVVREVPDDRLLVETDLHSAGEQLDDLLEDAYRRICEIKGWKLEDGVRKLGANFREFAYGAR